MKYIKYLVISVVALVLLNLVATWYLGKELDSYIQKQTTQLEKTRLNEKLTFKIVDDGFFSKTVAVVPTAPNTQELFRFHVYPGVIPFAAIAKSGLQPVLYYVDLNHQDNKLPDWVKTLDGYVSLTGTSELSALLENFDHTEKSNDKDNVTVKFAKARIHAYSKGNHQGKFELFVDNILVSEDSLPIFSAKSVEWDMELKDLQAYVDVFNAMLSGVPHQNTLLNAQMGFKAKELESRLPNPREGADFVTMQLSEVKFNGDYHFDLFNNYVKSHTFDLRLNHLAFNQDRIGDAVFVGKMENFPIDSSEPFSSDVDYFTISFKEFKVKTDKDVIDLEADVKLKQAAIQDLNSASFSAENLKAFSLKSTLDLRALSDLGQHIAKVAPITEHEAHDLSQATNYETLKVVFAGAMAREGYVKVDGDTVKADLQYDAETGKVRLTNGSEVHVHDLP